LKLLKRLASSHFSTDCSNQLWAALGSWRLKSCSPVSKTNPCAKRHISAASPLDLCRQSLTKAEAATKDALAEAAEATIAAELEADAETLEANEDEADPELELPLCHELDAPLEDGVSNGAFRHFRRMTTHARRRPRDRRCISTATGHESRGKPDLGVVEPPIPAAVPPVAVTAKVAA
jgi:hypothetical protein